MVRIKNKKSAALAALFILVLTFGLVSALTPWEKWYLRVDSYRDICVHEAYAIITYQSYRNPFILDVRGEGEFNGTEVGSPGHIADAVNIPHDQLVANLSEPASCPLVGHEEDTIIVYCKTGGRSANASETLAIHGFQIVYNMVGGIDMWTYSGYPVVTEAPPPPPTYTDITVGEAYNMIYVAGSCNIIVDVRTSGYAVEHLENAISIPYDNDAGFGTRLGPLSGHENDEIIVYCQNLACPKGQDACEYLVDHGFTKVFHMFEGIDEWKVAGFPVWTPPPLEGFPNPSAEDDSDSNGVPDYWEKQKASDVPGDWEWSTVAHTGVRSLVVTIQPNPSGNPWHVIQWRQYYNLDSVTCPFSRGATYKLRAWYQTENATLAIYVGMWDSSHRWIESAFQSEAVRSATPSTWEQSSWVTFTVPSSAEYIAVGMAIRLNDIDPGVSQALGRADDFEVQEVS